MFGVGQEQAPEEKPLRKEHRRHRSGRIEKVRKKGACLSCLLLPSVPLKNGRLGALFCHKFCCWRFSVFFVFFFSFFFHLLQFVLLLVAQSNSLHTCPSCRRAADPCCPRTSRTQARFRREQARVCPVTEIVAEGNWWLFDCRLWTSI